MEIQKFSREEIALRQIETALELLWRQGDLFSVITLAGAAEEILGQLLEARAGKRGALGSLLRILRPKERGLSGREIGADIHLAPRKEALFLLRRAIEDYVELSGVPSAAMSRFLNEELTKKG